MIYAEIRGRRYRMSLERLPTARRYPVVMEYLNPKLGWRAVNNFDRREQLCLIADKKEAGHE